MYDLKCSHLFLSVKVVFRVIERFRTKFTVNATRQVVPGDQFFHRPSFSVHDIFPEINQFFRVNFIHKKYFGQISIICSFPIVRKFVT